MSQGCSVNNLQVRLALAAWTVMEESEEENAPSKPDTRGERYSPQLGGIVVTSKQRQLLMRQRKALSLLKRNIIKHGDSPSSPLADFLAFRTGEQESKRKFN